jgi:trehalose 6-phosphate phosphatase
MGDSVPDGLRAPEPSTVAGRAALAAALDEPAQTLLVTDYDGTLAPVVSDPALAIPQPGAIAALNSLASRLGGLVVLTGRPVQEVVRLAELEPVGSLMVFGRYGTQRWAGGAVRDPEPPAALAGARAALIELVAGEPGAYLEDKGDALAVHTRPAPEPALALRRLRPKVESVAASTGLAVRPGKLVLELGAAGPGKGEAVTALVAERRPRSVIFIGDDAADLPAFDALALLRTRGTTSALLVASASAEEPRAAQAADLVLDGPAGVARFLRWLAAAVA